MNQFGNSSNVLNSFVQSQEASQENHAKSIRIREDKPNFSQNEKNRIDSLKENDSSQKRKDSLGPLAGLQKPGFCQSKDFQLGYSDEIKNGRVACRAKGIAVDLKQGSQRRVSQEGADEEEKKVNLIEDQDREQYSLRDSNQKCENQSEQVHEIKGLAADQSEDFQNGDTDYNEDFQMRSFNSQWNIVKTSHRAKGSLPDVKKDLEQKEKKGDQKDNRRAPKILSQILDENFADKPSLKKYAPILVNYLKEIFKFKEGETNFDVDEVIRFTPIVECGKGAFGEVDVMFDKATEKEVARKRFSTQEEREFNSLKVLKETNNPQLLKVMELNLDKDSSSFTVLMEYGISDLEKLTDKMVAKGIHWSDENLLSLYYQLLAQANELKKIKMVHWDIKPANIIVTHVGTYKLADYGFAQVLEKEGVQQMNVRGTPRFWHPELGKANQTRRKTCIIDPYEADNFSIKETINYLMKKDKKEGTIEDLLRKYPDEVKQIPLKELENLLKYQRYELLQRSSVLKTGEKLDTLNEFFSFQEIAMWLTEKLKEVTALQQLVPIFIIIGKSFKKNGQHTKALECYKIVENMKSNLDPRQAACLYKSFGGAAFKNHRFEAAENYFKKSLDLKRCLHGEESFEVAIIYYDLGHTKALQEEHETAFEYFSKVYEIVMKTPNEENLLLRIETMGELGYQHIWLEDIESGFNLFKEQIQLAKQSLGKQNRYYAGAIINLGYALIEKNEKKKALENLTKGLKIKKKIFGSNHASLVRPLNVISFAQQDLGNLEKALEAINESIRIHKYNNEDADEVLIDNLEAEKISILRKLGRHDQIINETNHNLNEAKITNNVGYHTKGMRLIEEGLFYLEKRDLKTAEQKFKQSIPYTIMDIQKADKAGLALNQLCTIYESQQRYQDGINFLSELIETFEKQIGSKNMLIGFSYMWLSGFYEKQGLKSEYEKAKKKMCDFVSKKK